jgi:hypothetical protein
MTRIDSTHIAPDTGVASLNTLQVVEKHERLRMTHVESLLEFKRGFNAGIPGSFSDSLGTSS